MPKERGKRCAPTAPRRLPRCNLCPTPVFVQQSDFASHNQTYHSEFKCPSSGCTTYCRSAEEVNKHRAQRHGWCSRCEQSGQTVRHLRQRSCTRVTFLPPPSNSATTPTASVAGGASNSKVHATSRQSEWRTRVSEDEEGNHVVYRFRVNSIRAAPY